MIIWPIFVVVALLVLVGVWIHERLPRWRAADARALREPLTAEQFGERFFPPDQAKIAARLRQLATDELRKDLSRLDPDELLAQVFFDASDSLDSVELLMAIEEEFGIELDEATAVKIKTFRDLLNAVAARQPFLAKWRREIGQAIERRFGITLPREALASLATPLAVTEAVAAELKGQVEPTPSCQSQRAFYLLRNALVRILGVPRRDITPNVSVHALTRRRLSPARAAQLREAVGARQWPTLVRPRWMVWSVRLLLLLTAIAVVWGLPALAEVTWLGGGAWGTTVNLLSELRGVIVIPLLIFLWVLLTRFSSRFSREFPRHIRTVSDLLPFVATSPEMTWTREQIEQAVRETITQKLRLPPGTFRVDGRFVEDFGMVGG